MVKGNSSENSHSSDFAYIPLLSSELNFFQDTIRSQTNSSQSVIQVPKSALSGPNLDSLENARLDRLFQVAEEREKSLAKPKYKATVIIEDTTAFKGSISRVYSDYVPSFAKNSFNAAYSQTNFLMNISEKTVNNHYKVKDTTKTSTPAVSLAIAPKEAVISGFEGDTRDFGTSGWYIFLLLISLSIFAWGKSLYQKYLLQIFNSVYNYQISIQLFRDKNALFRNLSIILQILFPLNLGLLVYFLIEFYRFNQVFALPISSIAVYSFSVFIFFRLKAWIYKFLGLVFKVQDEFHEIQHHLNIFNQSLGVALLPFVISMPFLNDSLKNVFLTGLFLLTGAFILLFFFRGFQIVSRKQVPVFFLILYLCAVEILPVALLLKTSYSIL